MRAACWVSWLGREHLKMEEEGKGSVLLVRYKYKQRRVDSRKEK